MNDEITIDVERLSFKYDGPDVLRAISFNVRKGEFIGLVGPNGSGKTTLLKCLCRLLKPCGLIYIDGTSALEYTLKELAKIFSYVSSEQPPGSGNVSVFDTIAAGRTPHMKGLWWECFEDEKVVLKSMELLSVNGLADRRVNELSSGERQRVRIARALAQQARIVLIDEPTAHLDLKHQFKIMRILKDLSKSGLTIVAALHDLNLALAYCDRILVLNEGKVFAFGKPNEILSKELVERVYGVKTKILMDKELDRMLIVPIE